VKTILCGLLFIYSSFSFATKLAVENSWPPYATINGSGYSVDIVKQAYKLVGEEIEFIVVPYSRALNMTLSDKVIGCFNVTKQADNADVYYFGLTPILKADSSFYLIRNSKKSYKKLSELPDGFKIGLIIDYEYGDMYETHKSRFKESRVSSQKQIIQMLELGRIDGAIMFDKVAKYTLMKMKKNINLINKNFLVHTSDIYVAFNKSNPKSRALAKLLDKGLALLKRNGDYKKIFSQKID
jgi:polar amino acid transport system substrate-binding protein